MLAFEVYERLDILDALPLIYHKNTALVKLGHLIVQSSVHASRYTLRSEYAAFY